MYYTDVWGTRGKNAREAYVEQLPRGRGLTACMNKKHEIFTNINPAENSDFAYRSTSNYLRQAAHQTPHSPTEMNSGRYLARTQSATDLSARTNRSTSGNPKYKAQEDYYDEIQAMKKDMKSVKEENSNLRSKVRRLEEDNARKRKEIDALYDPSKDGDLRRTLSGSNTDRNNNTNSNAANVVMSLKQRLFKLELQLKQKELEIDELKSDPKRTKSTELEIQNRALLGELERQKFERLNYIQKNDYMATIDEEKKNVVRKLNQEKDALKKENESLKKKLHDFQKLERGEELSARPTDPNHEKELAKKTDELKRVERERDSLRRDLDHTKDELDEIRRELEQKKKSKDHDNALEDVRRDLDRANEEIKKLKRERAQSEHKSGDSHEKLRDIERERDQFKKQLDRAKDDLEREREQFKKELHQVKEEQDRQKQFKSNQSLKRSESPSERITPFSRPDSPSRDDRQKATLKSTISSPRASKSDLHSIDTNQKRPTSATTTTNETALQTVQAALRGFLNRSEIDKPFDAGMGSDTNTKGKSTENQHKSDIMNRSTTSVADSKAKLRRSTSPDEDRSPSPPIKKNFGSKSSDLNKFGPDKRSTASNRDSLSKLRQSPPLDEDRPSSPLTKNNLGSKSSELNKFGPDKRSTANNRDSLSRLRQSPPLDEDRPSSPLPKTSFGSKSSDLNKFGPDKRPTTNSRDSLSKLRQSSPPPPVPERSTASPMATARSSKSNLMDDPNKFNRDSRPSSAKPTRPSREFSPDNNSSPSRANPNSSRSSLKTTPKKEETDDDDDIVAS